MSFFDSIFGWFSGNDDHCSVNPASGLPMVGGCGGVDVEGNPFGVDLHQTDTTTMFESNFSDDTGSSCSSLDDSFSSCSTGFDDSFSASSWDD